tara:strand:+ start:1142 stop:2041 length:900 start_codon:yes stop_codon:yes gene_type:complete
MNKIWNWQNLQVSWKVEGEERTSSIAVLLIHGFGASKDHWRFNQTYLGSIVPCYSIDLIGFGESSQPIAELLYEKKRDDGFKYCFDQWSQQITDFCEQVIQKPVLLVGNSIGGVIALHACKALSNKSSGVVLIDCAQRQMDDKRLMDQSIFMRFLRPVIKTLVRQKFLSESLFRNAAKPKFIEKVLKVAYPSGQNIDQELVQLLFRPTQRSGAHEAFRGFINLFDDYLATDLFLDCKRPIHMIWGEKDPWEPLEEAQKWSETFENIKTLDVISEAGHCPHDEMPDKVNPILKKIIQEAI